MNTSVHLACGDVPQTVSGSGTRSGSGVHLGSSGDPVRLQGGPAGDAPNAGRGGGHQQDPELLLLRALLRHLLQGAHSVHPHQHPVKLCSCTLMRMLGCEACWPSCCSWLGAASFHMHDHFSRTARLFGGVCVTLRSRRDGRTWKFDTNYYCFILRGLRRRILKNLFQ